MSLCPDACALAMRRRSRSRGFTLIELLVIVAIIGAMVTVSVVSVRAGQGAARVKGSVRDIFAIIRHARSVALVQQQPSVITYSEALIDGEPSAKIVITAAKILNNNNNGKVETLSGEPLKSEEKAVIIEEADSVIGEGGETAEDVLFAPVSEDVLRGMRLKVTKGDEVLESAGVQQPTKSRISVFSNVDYLLGKFNESKKKEEEKKAVEVETESEVDSASSELQESVSIVWEVNGRCEPHRVWIYPDGSTPEKGLSIKVDRFGGAKVLGEDDEE